MSNYVEDPYSDFVTRVVNSCRIALNKQGRMSDKEVEIVLAVRDTLTRMDPEIRPETWARKNVILRDMPTAADRGR